jgi:DNA-binding CsgD family transcriptional regulator
MTAGSQDGRVATVAAGLAGLAHASGDLYDRAAEALELIASVLPASTTALCLWDPLSKRHVPVASQSYPASVLDHLNSWFIDHDSLYSRMRHEGSGALRWQDVEGYRDSQSVQAVFEPAGFDEGLTACLFTPDGQYTGAFHLSSDDRRYPRNRDVALVNLLRTGLAALIDPAAAPRAVAQLLGEGAASFLVDGYGNTACLTGENIITPLLEDRAFMRAMSFCVAEDQYFRWGRGKDWWHVRIIRVARPMFPDDGTRLIIVREKELPYGITPRELDVLTLLSFGLGNVEISRILVISPRTAIHHVENIMAKLGVNSRAACGAIAVREGLVNLDGRLTSSQAHSTQGSGPGYRAVTA